MLDCRLVKHTQFVHAAIDKHMFALMTQEGGVFYGDEAESQLIMELMPNLASAIPDQPDESADEDAVEEDEAESSAGESH